MILNEINFLRNLDHPNIVKFHQIYELADEICLVMEYVEGQRLFAEIVRTKGIPERDTAVIMKQFFSILSYLQSQDIIHRDIKPENTIFQRDKNDKITIKLIDFGLAISNTQ